MVRLPVPSETPGLWVTYGPSIDSERAIRSVVEAGATGVRLTFSYGTAELQLRRARAVRDAASTAAHPVALIADLQGEKCRLAPIPGVATIAVDQGGLVKLCGAEPALYATAPRLLLQDPA